MTPTDGACLLRPAFRHAPRILGAAGALAAELIEPVREIDIIAAKAAFAQDCGDLGGYPARTFTPGIHDHAREARLQRQCAELLPFLRDAAVGVEGMQLAQ
jgi:hypothetical protein